MFLQKNILHLHRYFTIKDQKHKYKKYILLEQLRMINMQRTSAIEFFCILEQVCFSSLSESASIFLILTNCFFEGMMANFDTNIFIIARENSCKIDRAPYGVRLISYNASADVFIYRRRPAPVRYVTSQKKILKNRPVPGRLSNSPVMSKSLKSYDVSFICDRSITRVCFLETFVEATN